MPALANRVQETTTTGGTGTITLGGAVTGYVTFASAFATSTVVFYTIDNGAGEWEVGIGTLVTASTLSRDTVINSSNSNALVNFAAGTKRVFCSAPTKALLPNQTGNSGKVLSTGGSDPNWTTTLNGMTIGNVTPGSGAFTTLSASSTVSGTGFSTYLASPPAIGGTTPAAGAFTTLSSTGNTTLGDASGDTLTINAGTTTFAQGTANGVLYLNGSKVATSGSGLTFDGTNLGVGKTPISGWVGKAIEVGFAGSATQSPATGYMRLLANAYQGGGGNFYYAASSVAAKMYEQSPDSHAWHISTDGTQTAGSAIAFSQDMTLTHKGLLVGYTSDASLSGTGNAIFSGNVGIGTSSPAQKLDVRNDTSNTSIRISTSDNGNITRVGWRTGVAFLAAEGYNSPALAFDTAGTQRMLLDISGNLGLGVTPSAWVSSWKAVQIGASGALASRTDVFGTILGQNWFINSAGNDAYIGSSTATAYRQREGQHQWLIAPSGTAGNPIIFNTAMTLDASGNLLVGKTNASVTTVGMQIYPSGGLTSTLAGSTSSTSTLEVYSTGASAYRFYVGMNGSVNATNTTIAAISDQRLKENIQDLDIGLNAILALKPRKFDWKAGKGKDIKGDRGFIAQEFEQVFPDLIDEWKDPAPEGEEPYKSVRPDLIPVLVKAIQELTARLEALEAK